MKITLSMRELRALFLPVLPHACRDDMPPVLNGIRIESRSEWLTAAATDRFRVSVQRIAKSRTDDDDTTVWPEFKALVPVASVKAILAQFKAARGSEPDLTLTVDGDMLVVEAAGAFVLFDQARLTYRLLDDASFPDLDPVFSKAIRDGGAAPADGAGFNPKFLADYASLGTIRVRVGPVGQPCVITNDEGFLGLLMPRRMATDAAEDWTSFFPLPDAKPAAA